MTGVNGHLRVLPLVVKGPLISRPLVNESYSISIAKGCPTVYQNISTFVHEAVRLE